MKKRLKASLESMIALEVGGKVIEFPRSMPLNPVIGMPKQDGVECYIPSYGVVRKEYPSNKPGWFLDRVKVGTGGWTPERMRVHTAMIEVLGPTTVMPGPLVDFVLATYAKAGRLRTIIQTMYVLDRVGDPRPRKEVDVIVDTIAGMAGLSEKKVELQKAPEEMKEEPKEKKLKERRSWTDGDL